MNRFRSLGFIDYNGRIKVHRSLLNVVLLDQLPEHGAAKQPVLSTSRASIELSSNRKSLFRHKVR